MNSKDYWVGVFLGLSLSLIFCTASCFVMIQETRAVKQEMREVRERVEQAEREVAEDRQIMKTYKFFNESWRAIIEMEERRGR